MHIGKNTVRVTQSTLSKTSKGDPMVVVEIESIDSGKCLLMHKALSEAAWGFSCDDLALMGWDPRENAYQFNLLADGPESALVGLKTFDVEIVEEDYKGKPVLKVKYIYGAGSQPMPQDDLLAFCRRMREREGIPEPEVPLEGTPF